MLYQSETLRELHSFAAFCRGKPADGTYDFFSSRSCACGQYLEAQGVWRHDWSFPGQIGKHPGLQRLNELAWLACASPINVGRSPINNMGRWGDLLKLVEREIERELHDPPSLLGRLGGLARHTPAWA